MTRHACLGILAIVPLLILMGISRPVSGAVRLPWSMTATVTRVIDGVTIEVAYQGRREEVHYLGLHTPASMPPTPGAAFSRQEAAAANRRLVEGQTVRLDFDTVQRNREGRLLAYVYAGDVMVNAELIRQGVAQVVTEAPRIKYLEWFLTLQREAREAKRGVWGPLPQ